MLRQRLSGGAAGAAGVTPATEAGPIVPGIRTSRVDEEDRDLQCCLNCTDTSTLTFESPAQGHIRAMAYREARQKSKPMLSNGSATGAEEDYSLCESSDGVDSNSTGPWKNSATGTRTRVARVRAKYPNQLDYSGSAHEDFI